MKWIRNLIDLSYYFTYIFKSRNNSLRILIHHDIKSKRQISLFKNQISKLSEKYEFISPEQFEKIITAGKVKGRKILLTFDDGFKSNRFVAENILNEKGIKAIFFIVSDFFGINKKSPKYHKLIKNIYPKGPNINELSESMHQKDIQFLINTGHTIGCHSATHQILSKIISEKELRKELLNSKNNLEKIFDIKIKHFAFPFGTFESINKKSLKLLSENYSFIHSGLRGNNSGEQKLLYRDATNPEMSIIRLKAFLLGNVDLIYKYKFKTLKSFLIDSI
jgi:peptidoglycan/xylan/chitin deacetylase (PgdA/CDA1 family)